MPHTTIINTITKGEVQGGNPSDDVNMEMQKCGAYEVVQFSRQRVIINDNPAYGEIGVGLQTERLQ